jgi:4-hydroxy-tetrahydrodipicolinate synthase
MKEGRLSKFGVEDIRGVVPPIATPIDKEERVDDGGMRRLVNFLIDQGSAGLFVLGGTGEYFCLADREKTRAVEIVVDEVGGRVPVIAGVSDLSTRRAIDNAHAAQEAGADFLVSLPPFFFPLEQEWISNFYTAIAADTDLPLMLYNVINPFNTNILPQTALSLSENPGIVGMKDSAELSHVEEVVSLTGGSGFRVLNGIEGHFTSALRAGAAGGVLSAANFCPRLCADIYEKTVAGELDEAEELQDRLNRLKGELSGRFKPWWAVVKTSLNILGICESTLTHPMPTCTDEERAALAGIMKEYDLL